MIERHTIEQSVLEDKVWLPSDDMTADRVIPLGKEYVTASAYRMAKDKFNEFNNILLSTTSHIKQIPFKTTQHFDKRDQREFQ